MKRILAFFLVSVALFGQAESSKAVNRDPNSTGSELVFEIVSLLAKLDSEVNHLTPQKFAGALLATNVAVPHVAQPHREHTTSSTGTVNLPYSVVDTVVAPSTVTIPAHRFGTPLWCGHHRRKRGPIPT